MVGLGAAISLGVFFLGRYVVSHSNAAAEPTRGPLASSQISEKSIAVLPFENLSDEKQNAYFAEGIQDEILTRLSKIADLQVISRTSTQKYVKRLRHLLSVPAGQVASIARLRLT